VLCKYLLSRCKSLKSHVAADKVAQIRECCDHLKDHQFEANVAIGQIKSSSYFVFVKLYVEKVCLLNIFSDFCVL
jgi:hypothetical protein